MAWFLLATFWGVVLNRVKCVLKRGAYYDQCGRGNMVI